MILFKCIGQPIDDAFVKVSTTDMVFTTLLFAVVARTRWQWSRLSTLGIATPLLVVDVGFWAANLPKIPHGGWFPLVIVGLIFILMTTWKRPPHSG